MQTRIEGAAYVLGDNIDTDQIIPAQYLTYNPSIPEECKIFGKFALSGVPDDQAGLAEGARPVPRAGRRRVRFALHDHHRRQELRLRVAAASTPRSRWPRPASCRHRRVLRPHLLPQQRQRRLPGPARSEERAGRRDLHRRQARHRHDRRDADEHHERRDRSSSCRSARSARSSRPAACSPTRRRWGCSRQMATRKRAESTRPC